MKNKIIRHESDRKSTLGVMLIDNSLACYSLEPGYKDSKIAGCTRIPNGTYNLGLRTTGGFHEKYKKRFSFHKGMLWLLNVPNFEYVYIHVGNTFQDTSACVLVGSSVGNLGGECAVLQSVKAYEKIYPMIAEKILLGHSVRIEISSTEGV